MRILTEGLNAMILKRKVYERLLDWRHESNGSKAIFLEGARCISKSTIVEEFVFLHI